MPAPHDKVRLTCPYCGHQQLEPRTAFSTVCRKCARNLRVQEILKPPPKPAEPTFVCKLVTCFDCGADLAANLSVDETLVLKSTARLFGDVNAGNMIVEEGAVVVGRIGLGLKPKKVPSGLPAVSSLLDL